ncbi:hypothetical protein ACFWUW_14095 [Streptomyces sp. NPDC058655]|uniref:hypothetical protein n=1 Tax=Streptomyces sp. NPDC058655 TaxID=3346577 RepID=UPI00364B8B76
MSTHPAIADHGMVGGLHSAASVSSDAPIDSWCTPRAVALDESFDTAERGGTDD